MKFVAISFLALNLLIPGTETILVNAGKGGNNSRDLLKRLESDVLIHQPDLVIVGVGTNDAINSKNPVSLSEFETNCTTLIQKIRASGAEVIFLDPPPCYDPFVLKRHTPDFFRDESPSQKIRTYRAVLAKTCARESASIIKIYETFLAKGNIGEDKASWMQNPENSGKTDGVHPTAEGYQAIAGLVAQSLRENGLQSNRRIVCFGDSITFGAGVKGAGTVQGETYPAILRNILQNAITSPSTQ